MLRRLRQKSRRQRVETKTKKFKAYSSCTTGRQSSFRSPAGSRAQPILRYSRDFKKATRSLRGATKSCALCVPEAASRSTIRLLKRKTKRHNLSRLGASNGEPVQVELVSGTRNRRHRTPKIGEVSGIGPGEKNGNRRSDQHAESGSDGTSRVLHDCSGGPVEDLRHGFGAASPCLARRESPHPAQRVRRHHGTV